MAQRISRVQKYQILNGTENISCVKVSNIETLRGTKDISCVKVSNIKQHRRYLKCKSTKYLTIQKCQLVYIENSDGI